MHVIRRRGWEIPEHQATPEACTESPQLHQHCPAATLVPRIASAQRVADIPDPSKDLIRPSATRNTRSGTGRSRRRRSMAATIISTNSASPRTSPRRRSSSRSGVDRRDRRHGGKPFEIAIDDLIRQMPLEERLYRHRCVEAWSMTIPWTGFPLAKLVELAKPLSSAKYVQMTTFQDKTARVSATCCIRGPTPRGSRWRSQ